MLNRSTSLPNWAVACCSLLALAFWAELFPLSMRARWALRSEDMNRKSPKDHKIFSLRRTNPRNYSGTARYSYIPSEDQFFIESDGQQHAVLFARLAGQRSQSYSCFMVPTNHRHVCPGAEHLATGVWNVSVTLYRQQLPFYISSDTLLLEYVMRHDVSKYEELLGIVQYPRSNLMSFSWNKSSIKNQVDNSKIVQCTEDSAGVWQLFQGDCRPPNCDGDVDTNIMATAYNMDSGQHHVFVPFTCHYKFYSRNEASQ